MGLDFHPILVHFPIAFLMVYSIFELLNFKFLKKYSNWIYIKAVILIVGTLGAFPALLTGSILGEALEGQSDRIAQLVELHAGFAIATTVVYSIISVIYLIILLSRSEYIMNKISFFPEYLKTIISWLLVISKKLFNVYFLSLSSIIGIILITIAGGLGGALAYGSNIDPIVYFVYNLFF